MKIVLVGPEIEENLALGYLQSSLLAAGHECTTVAFNADRELRPAARRILRSNPDLIGLSLVAQRRYGDFQRLAHLLRERGFKGHITAGGHFASLRANEVLSDTPELDSILHHDAEERIVSLLKWRGFTGDPPGELDGITWRIGDGTLRHRPAMRVADIDRVSAPARRRADRTLGFARAPMVTSRGCSGACSFCSIHAWHRQVPSGRLRFRSPEQVAGEMASLYKERDVRVFVFHDDDFIHPDPPKALERCRAIFEAAEQKTGAAFAFVIKCRPDHVEEGLFRYLKSKGLVRVYVGIETNSGIGMRTLNRRTTKEMNERSLAILRGLGVFACFNLLIFHPDSTREELDENLSFLERHSDLPFDIARTELYARSALETRMVREGRTIGDYRGFDYRIGDPVAEAAFRLFAAALWERHFGGNPILQGVQDLGYRLSLLERFYPEMASLSLKAGVRSLIREVNADTIDYMRRLLCAAVSAQERGEPARREELVTEMRREIAGRIRLESGRLRALSFQLEASAMLGRFGIGGASSGIEWPRVIVRLAAVMPSVALMLISPSCQKGVCDPPPPPMFSSGIAPHLDQTCAVPGCHVGDTAAAGLILTTGSSYSNLVGRPSTEVPRLKRVDPFRPDSSYLVRKFEGTQQAVGGSGERMPKGGRPNDSFVQKVREWISFGAGK